MPRLSLICLGLLAFTSSGASSFAQDLPSGQKVVLQEILTDHVGDETWLRFRFIAPHISREAGETSYEEVSADMKHLCETVAVPNVKKQDVAPDKVVISLADQQTEFGVANPEVTQFFDLFSIEGQVCIWEAL